MSFEEREGTVRPLDDRAPVLVGIGTVEQRHDDPADATEPLDLMLEAIQRAGADSGRPELLARVDYVAVPRGRWRYEDPGRYLADAIGSERADSILALVGVLQQSLIGEACQRIADGHADVAVVVGGEAGYRRLRGRLLGVPTPETSAPGAPKRTWIVLLATASPFESMRKLYDTFALPLTCGTSVANGRFGPGP